MSATVVTELARRAAGRVTVFGLSDPAAAFVAAELVRAGSFVVTVVPDEQRSRTFARDLDAYVHGEGATDDPSSPPPILQLPAHDTSPYAELSPDRDQLQGRLAGLYHLSSTPTAVRAVVLSSASLQRRVIVREELAALSFDLQSGGDIDRDQLAQDLSRAGFARTPVVEDPGTYAVRGGVVDIFSPLYRFPIRIDLFGDEIESLRWFDPATQRTLKELERVVVHPVRETIVTGGVDLRSTVLDAADTAAHPSKQTRALLERLEAGDEFVGIETLTPAFHRQMGSVADYLPHSAAWLVIDPEGIARRASDLLESAELRYRDRIEDHKIAFPPREHYLERAELEATLAHPAHCISASTLEVQGGDDERLHVRVENHRELRSALEQRRRLHSGDAAEPLISAISAWLRDGYRVSVASSSVARRDRITALLRESEIAIRADDSGILRPAEVGEGGPVVVASSSLSRGYLLPDDRIAVITDEDVFGPRVSTQDPGARKRAKAALMGASLDFSELSQGDYLVHQLHGIGCYQGLVKLPVGGTPVDFLHLEYTGGSLYLPVHRIGEVQRYVGAEGHSPRLDRLGGQTFEKSRKKVSRAVRALAEQLLQLYAQRAALPGHAFPAPDAMYRDFEATFAFDETPDQERAIADVESDMSADRPMDRLVCGDVGYGKTEVALRAIFRAALGGRQSALLAPTTVLVEQHFQTMRDRFRGWPLRVGRLSRFQHRKEQVRTLKELADGTLDAVVGTHRVLSSDVRFKDLGLIVVDEEQRFGVTHKEKLKKVRTQVDVLTLTATPIPRTLHLAMTGLRDLSIIATPPADRRSVRTLVARPEAGVLKEAIRAELARGGQVFLVAPNIQTPRGSSHRSLADWAEYLRELCPEARVVVAHGQMPAEELEKAMITFVGGEADVLVSTTIIESGLDIPRANTMFVDRADRFGLAQLYQLRGRIGRAKERAYCYLLVPPPDSLTDDARRRLETLQRFTELGAGFAIASQDLEIRGGGELLGAKQSGSIAAVGFDAYIQILEDAIADLQGEEIHRASDPELNTEIPGFIPDEYIPDAGLRLGLYKRLSAADGEDAIRELCEEIADRYGPLPPETSVLADLMVLKSLARDLGAEALSLTESHLSLTLGENTRLSPQHIKELIVAPGSRLRLTPDMRLSYRLSEAEEKDPVAAARTALRSLAEGCADVSATG